MVHASLLSDSVCSCFKNSQGITIWLLGNQWSTIANELDFYTVLVLAIGRLFRAPVFRAFSNGLMTIGLGFSQRPKFEQRQRIDTKNVLCKLAYHIGVRVFTAGGIPLTRATFTTVVSRDPKLAFGFRVA